MAVSKNTAYEERKKAQGLVKVTLWIPMNAKIELTSMAAFCCEYKNHVPFMARSLVTGKMKKAI